MAWEYSRTKHSICPGCASYATMGETWNTKGAAGWEMIELLEMPEEIVIVDDKDPSHDNHVDSYIVCIWKKEL